MRFKTSHSQFREKQKRKEMVEEPPKNFYCDICKLTFTNRAKYGHTRSISHYKRLYNICDDSRKVYTFYNTEDDRRSSIKDYRHKFYVKNQERIKGKNLEHYYKKKLENQSEPEIIPSTLSDSSRPTINGEDDIFVNSDTF